MMPITLSTHWMKYLPFILVGAGFVLAVFYTFKKDHLLQFVVESMKTDGKPDSKKMSGFVLNVTLILGFFIAIYYADKHQPPEYYVWVIAMLITSFYGIREVSRFITTKYTGAETATVNGSGNATPPPAAVTPTQPGEKKNEKNEDIG